MFSEMQNGHRVISFLGIKNINEYQIHFVHNKKNWNSSISNQLDPHHIYELPLHSLAHQQSLVETYQLYLYFSLPNFEKRKKKNHKSKSTKIS